MATERGWLLCGVALLVCTGLSAAGCGGKGNKPADAGDSAGAGGHADAAAGGGAGGNQGDASAQPPADAAPDTGNPPPPDDGAAPDRARDAADARDGDSDSDGAGTPDAGPPDVPTNPDTGPDTNGCSVDCTHLPHVRAGANVTCLGNQCFFGSDACETDYAHCSGSPNGGCETALNTVAHCGSCFTTCGTSPDVECATIFDSYRTCVTRCVAPTPDRCGYSCVDLKSFADNCGGCGHSCYAPNGQAVCSNGTCGATNCYAGWSDCTTEPGCETTLGSELNCGACGDKACALANTLFTCSDGPRCDGAVCSPGFANCDVTSPDCETDFNTAGTCLPHYADTFPIATGGADAVVTAIAADGSVFLGGTYSAAVDFNPSAGKDIRTPADYDAFVTKFNADGSYGWTATFEGRGTSQVTGLAVTPTGAVAVVGTYNDTIDLDPSAIGNVRQTVTPTQNDAFVLELTAAGTLAWGGTFVGAQFNFDSVAPSVAVDATGAVLVTRSYEGTIDADPGPGVTSHTAFGLGAMLVKLTASGTLAAARFYDNGNCGAALQSVTVASDGSVWAAGTATRGPGCALNDSMDGQQQIDILLVKHDAANAPVAKWVFGTNQAGPRYSVAPGRDGAVYLAGSGSQIDFDPGPAVVHRWLGNYSGAFILKLDATAAFRWVRALPDQDIGALAATSDGGVIAAAQAGFVTRLDGNGASVWTFQPLGPASQQSSTPNAIASAGTRFAIAGTSHGNVDMDPGVDLSLVYGDIAYVSRFTF